MSRAGAIWDCSPCGGDALQEFGAFFGSQHEGLVHFGSVRLGGGFPHAQAIHFVGILDKNAVLGDGHAIAGFERDHFHALAVYERAIHAAEILEHEAALDAREDARVMMRDRAIIDDQAVVGGTADFYAAAAHKHFLQGGVFKLQHEFVHLSGPLLRLTYGA